MQAGGLRYLLVFHMRRRDGAGAFLGVIGLGVLGRRFWCRYLCPTGALYSLATVLRLRQRRVSDAFIACGKCVDVCPFDAVNDDFSTRVRDCAFCPECVAVCPVGAISFGKRTEPEGVSSGPPLSRRGFIEVSAAGVFLLEEHGATPMRHQLF